MVEVETIHETDGTQIRRVALENDEEHEFVVDESGEFPTHDYRGEGEPPAAAVNALEQFVAEYHEEYTATETNDQGASTEGAQ